MKGRSLLSIHFSTALHECISCRKIVPEFESFNHSNTVILFYIYMLQ